MNNSNNKNDKIELDELNIKSHLNTSLDLSGISVSEDLINRTLAAIKEQNISSKDDVMKTSITEPTKKVIAWNRYIRGFAGVAAAVIIVMVGYNMIQRIPIGMKKSEDAAMPELTTSLETKMAASEAAPAEENQAFDSNAAAMEKADDVQYSIMAETGALVEESSEVTSGEDSSTNAQAGEAEIADVKVASEGSSDNAASTQEFAALDRSAGEMVIYTFREIFVPSPEQAEYITISDHRSNTSITLTQKDDIEAFYIIMDSHQFSDTGNGSLIDPNYSVEMNNPELGTLYTMLVGTNLTVRYTQGESTLESIYYAIEDSAFKQDLEEFFVEHSE